jgi:hypothetical protein
MEVADAAIAAPISHIYSVPLDAGGIRHNLTSVLAFCPLVVTFIVVPRRINTHFRNPRSLLVFRLRLDRTIQYGFGDLQPPTYLRNGVSFLV